MSDFVTLLNRIGSNFPDPLTRRDALLALHKRRRDVVEPIDVEAIIKLIEEDCKP